MASKKAQVGAALLTMYIAWGTTYVGIALAIESMPDLLSMGMRFLEAASLQFLLVGFKSGFGQFRISRRQLRNTFTLGTMMLAVGLGTMSAAEHVVPLSAASLIVASMPIWTGLFRMLDGDRPTRSSVIGIAAGFIGILIILQPGQTITRAGGNASSVTLWMFIILLGNLSWSIGSFITTRLDTPKNTMVLTTIEMFAAGIVLTACGLLSGQEISDFLDATTRSWFGWTYLVVVGSVVGYSTYNFLLNNAPISLVSTYSYVNPVVATALGLVIFNEPLTHNIVVGGLVVLVSVAIVITSENANTKKKINAQTS